MKRVFSIILFTVFCFLLAACATEGQSEPLSTEQQYDESVEAQSESVTNDEIDEMSDSLSEETSQNNQILVVYFSATGTTKSVAETIASVAGAELYEITPAQPYSSDDLNYNDENSRTTKEQNDKTVRPKISGVIENWESYSVVYLGYPIWWGQEPRIMDTFVESYSFDGKTIIPFCTSGSSGVGSSDSNLEDNAKIGNWLEGTGFDGTVSEKDIRTWIDKLDIN